MLLISIKWVREVGETGHHEQGSGEGAMMQLTNASSTLTCYLKHYNRSDIHPHSLSKSCHTFVVSVSLRKGRELLLQIRASSSSVCGFALMGKLGRGSGVKEYPR